MVTTQNQTNSNSTIGLDMTTTINKPMIKTEDSLSTIIDDVTVDTTTETDTETQTNTSQYQNEIDEIAKNALFDGNGYSTGNPNGKAKEYEIVLKDKTYNAIKDNLPSSLPIEKLADLSSLTDKEKELRLTLLDDLQKAQFHTIGALYHYVRVGKLLLTIQSERVGKKQSLQRIIASVGLNDRTAFRYMKIAKDDRFVKMTEEQFKSLHHLTQSKMIIMTEFNNDEFCKAIKDEDYPFPIKEKNESKPSTYAMSEERYKELMGYKKDYVVKKYDDLYSDYLDLEEKYNELINQSKKEVA